MKALDVSSSAESFGNLFPVFASVNSYSLSKFLILNLGPMTLDLDMISLGMVLSSLVFSWPSLVKMGVKHLMSDEFLLSLAVSQIIQIIGHFHFLIFD